MSEFYCEIVSGPGGKRLRAEVRDRATGSTLITGPCAASAMEATEAALGKLREMILSILRRQVDGI
jgi:hypothetical protein